MAKTTLEQRVQTLEAEVQELRAELHSKTTRKKDWRRTAGMFTDDEGMKELFREALKIREADRAKARKKYAKRRTRK